MRALRYLVREAGLVVRPRWAHWLLAAALLLSFASGWMAWQALPSSPRHALRDCSDRESRAYLQRLCRDYASGVVGGSLCEPLCVRREVEFVRCLGHGVKMHVLQAQWAGNTVVLKTNDLIDNHTAAMHVYWERDRHRVITRDEFIREANQTLFMNLARGRHVAGSLAAVERVFSECDVLGDGQLSYSEAVVCWQLLETDEFVLLSVLEGTSAIPDLYGACGNMYAMQYATSDPFLDKLPPTVDRRSWAFRARLAIALIEMVHSIEVTPYGTLYLCDVKGSNFGLVRQPDSGELVAKAIDLDLSWFEAALVQRRSRKRCQKDSDCDYIACHIACSPNSHTCSGPVLSNNLQAVCEWMFLPLDRWHLALLWGSPARVEGKRELGAVLEQCASPSPHINTLLMNRLLSLLHDSLLTETSPI